MPGYSAEITAHPQTSKFYPERLLIKDASHWKIDVIRASPRAGALVQDLPGTAFSPDAPGRFPGCGELEIPPGGELTIGVTYTGLYETGIPFEACVFGSDDRPPPVASISRRWEKKLATATSGRAITVEQSAKLFTAPMEHDVWLTRLVIKEASNWIVNDAYIGELSIFAQSGDVPGSLFSEYVESVSCLGHLAAGEKFSVVVTYVGSAPGAEFEYSLYGTPNEAETAGLALAAILPMSTGILILPTQSAQLTARGQLPNAHRRGIGPTQGFVAERIVVEGAADWVFNDIKIGRSSQFAASGDVPGLAFSPGILGGAVSFDVARAGINVAIVTTHVGPRKGGAAFSCGILGSLIDLPADPAP